MIKINDSWIDENEIISIHKEQSYKDKDTNDYDIRVHTKDNSYYPIKFYLNKQLRDIEFDKLGELLSKRDEIQDDKKDYIQGFKSGVEYALKVKQ